MIYIFCINYNFLKMDSYHYRKITLDDDCGLLEIVPHKTNQLITILKDQPSHNDNFNNRGVSGPTFVDKTDQKEYNNMKGLKNIKPNIY